MRYKPGCRDGRFPATELQLTNGIVVERSRMLYFEAIENFLNLHKILLIRNNVYFLSLAGSLLVVLCNVTKKGSSWRFGGGGDWARLAEDLLLTSKRHQRQSARCGRRRWLHVHPLNTQNLSP